MNLRPPFRQPSSHRDPASEAIRPISIFAFRPDGSRQESVPCTPWGPDTSRARQHDALKEEATPRRSQAERGRQESIPRPTGGRDTSRVKYQQAEDSMHSDDPPRMMPGDLRWHFFRTPHN